MASSKNSNSRDWGKGFACAGRQKICTIVPQDHFGPIPGVEVGSLWKFRLQVKIIIPFKIQLRKHFFINFKSRTAVL